MFEGTPATTEPAAAETAADVPGFDESVALIAHELRTPLAVVEMAASLAIDDLPDDASQQRELLETIRRNNELANLLLKRLPLARDLDQDGASLELVDLDIDALVHDAVNDLRHVILERHPTTVTSGGHPVRLRADAAAIRQILFNLLSNAAKYSRDGAPIDVLLEPEPRAVHVTVRNHGSGVTPGHTDAIFDKFSRDPNSSNGARPGAGLGLFISRALARAHGGDINVRPAAQIGSEFRLSLPLGERDGAPDPA